MDEICYKAIGIIESPYDHALNMPVQSLADNDIRGKIIVDPKYMEGLKNLDQFSHIYVIYHLHLSRGYQLVAKPFLDDADHGIFAIRAPRRPNPIGLSIVKLEKVIKNVLYITGIDMVNGTPIIDIKPFIPAFDIPENPNSGWLKLPETEINKARSDNRFSQQNEIKKI